MGSGGKIVVVRFLPSLVRPELDAASSPNVPLLLLLHLLHLLLLLLVAPRSPLLQLLLSFEESVPRLKSLPP